MEDIKKDMLIGELVTKHPECAPMIAKFGMHCVGCHASAMETLEQGCKAHGLPDEKIDELVKELNKLIRKEIEQD